MRRAPTRNMDYSRGSCALRNKALAPIRLNPETRISARSVKQPAPEAQGPPVNALSGRRTSDDCRADCSTNKPAADQAGLHSWHHRFSLVFGPSDDSFDFLVRAFHTQSHGHGCIAAIAPEPPVRAIKLGGEIPAITGFCAASSITGRLT